MKAMGAFARHEWAIVPRRLAISATIVKGVPTNTAIFMFRDPLPCSNSEETIDFDVHIVDVRCVVLMRPLWNNC